MQPDQRIGTTTLVEQSYWDRSYAHMAPTIAPADDTVRRWIERYVPKAIGDAHCLEVGCFPGRYLGVFGQRGYVVHGIDLTPAVQRMKEAFDGLGLCTGTFVEADFLTYQPSRVYDVVCSFGFIEHFDDWRGVVRKHAQLVAPGGLIVLEAPNFQGWVQRFFHAWLDAENLRRHNLSAMDPAAWAEILRAEGFEVTCAGWFGRFDFWHDTTRHGAFHHLGFLLLRLVAPLLVRFPEGSRALSPYCGLVARKR